MDSIHTCTQLMGASPRRTSEVPKVLLGKKNYQFIRLTKGLSSAPHLFSKMMKSVSSKLREIGHITSGYLDDSYLVGYTFCEC